MQALLQTSRQADGQTCRESFRCTSGTACSEMSDGRRGRGTMRGGGKCRKRMMRGEKKIGGEGLTIIGAGGTELGGTVRRERGTRDDHNKWNVMRESEGRCYPLTLPPPIIPFLPSLTPTPPNIEERIKVSR